MTGSPNADAGGMRRIQTLFLCLTAVLAPLWAATLEQLSLNDLTRKSTAIVRVKVVGSYADLQGAEIYTHWKLRVVESWKGANQTTAEVQTPGGSVRGYRQSVPGSPQLITGREYLLFLWTSRRGATYLTGWGQGVFELAKDDANRLLATRAGASATMVEPKTWRTVKDSGLQMRYSELTARISGTLAQGAGR